MSLKIEEIEYSLPSNIEDIKLLEKDNPSWDLKKILEKTGVTKRFEPEDEDVDGRISLGDKPDF